MINSSITSTNYLEKWIMQEWHYIWLMTDVNCQISDLDDDYTRDFRGFKIGRWCCSQTISEIHFGWSSCRQWRHWENHHVDVRECLVLAEAFTSLCQKEELLLTYQSIITHYSNKILVQAIQDIATRWCSTYSFILHLPVLCT